MNLTNLIMSILSTFREQNVGKWQEEKKEKEKYRHQGPVFDKIQNKMKNENILSLNI